MATATAIATKADALEELLIRGNLAVMSPEQRTDYYRRLCDSLDLNPLTQPFQYLTLSGKLVLYFTRAGAEQLAERRRIAIRFISDGIANDVYTYRVEASTPDGRTVPGIGAVSVKGLSGDALCNAMMKAETKACRRATIRICGLGILDESEVESIPGAVRVPHEPPAKQLPEKQAEPPTEKEVDTFADLAELIDKSSTLEEHKAAGFVVNKALKTANLTKEQRDRLADRVKAKGIALKTAAKKPHPDDDGINEPPGVFGGETTDIRALLH